MKDAVKHGKPLPPVQYPRRRAHHLELVEGVGLNTGKPASGRLDVIRLNGESEKFCLDKAVVPTGKLPPEHGGILGADTVKVVPLGRYLNGFLEILLVGVPVDKG